MLTTDIIWRSFLLKLNLFGVSIQTDSAGVNGWKVYNFPKVFGLYGKLFETMIVKNSDQAALIEPFSDLLLVSV